jgi:hypothetical protein
LTAINKLVDRWVDTPQIDQFDEIQGRRPCASTNLVEIQGGAGVAAAPVQPYRIARIPSAASAVLG